MICFSSNKWLVRQQRFTQQCGLASLPTVMAITILILAIGIGISAVSFSEILITSGHQQSAQAFVYAEVGARDALIKISRNKNFTCASEDCYLLDSVPAGCYSGEGCAKVSVSAGVGSVADPKVITSKGIVNINIRRIQVDVVYDASLNGEIASTTWRELVD